MREGAWSRWMRPAMRQREQRARKPVIGEGVVGGWGRWEVDDSRSVSERGRGRMQWQSMSSAAMGRPRQIDVTLRGLSVEMSRAMRWREGEDVPIEAVD